MCTANLTAVAGTFTCVVTDDGAGGFDEHCDPVTPTPSGTPTGTPPPTPIPTVTASLTVTDSPTPSPTTSGRRALTCTRMWRR